MNDGLLDAFRHNAWATHRLLEFCRDLTPAQLAATVTGVYGSPVATLEHLIASEASYCFRLSDQRPDWAAQTAQQPSVDELIKRATDMASRWEAFLSEPFDAERILVYRWKDGELMDVPAGIVLAQALHHGNEH